MKIADVQTFLTDNHRGVLVARKRDGWPQITLVTPGIDAEGCVLITSRGTTYKVKNIRRDPRVSMLIMGEQFRAQDMCSFTAQRKSSLSPRRWTS